MAITRPPPTRLFRALAQAALAGAAGCGEDEGEPFTCDLSHPRQLTTPLAPAEPVDYLGVFRAERMMTQELIVSAELEFGERCAEVADASACSLAFEQLQRQNACTQLPCAPFIVARSGEQLRRVDDRAQFIALLGKIDTTSEALLVAAYENHPVTCDDGSFGTYVRRRDGAYSLTTTWDDCGLQAVRRNSARISAAGEYRVTSNVKLASTNCNIGRRPAGLRDRGELPQANTRVGLFLAEAARLEAASVFAFARLARELRELSAPLRLRQLALAAMRDEIRHANVMGKLARDYGADVAEPEVADVPPRSAFEIAAENASEGCVRETFGALVAAYQAESATDPRVRQALSVIAQDEARHSALSWRVARWLEPRLTPREQAEVRERRARALRELFDELDYGLDASDCEQIGIPTPAVAHTLLTSLAPHLGLQT